MMGGAIETNERIAEINALQPRRNFNIDPNKFFEELLKNKIKTETDNLEDIFKGGDIDTDKGAYITTNNKNAIKMIEGHIRLKFNKIDEIKQDNYSFFIKTTKDTYDNTIESLLKYFIYIIKMMVIYTYDITSNTTNAKIGADNLELLHIFPSVFARTDDTTKEDYLQTIKVDDAENLFENLENISDYIIYYVTYILLLLLIYSELENIMNGKGKLNLETIKQVPITRPEARAQTKTRAALSSLQGAPDLNIKTPVAPEAQAAPVAQAQAQSPLGPLDFFKV